MLYPIELWVHPKGEENYRRFPAQASHYSGRYATPTNRNEFWHGTISCLKVVWPRRRRAAGGKPTLQGEPTVRHVVCVIGRRWGRIEQETSSSSTGPC